MENELWNIDDDDINDVNGNVEEVNEVEDQDPFENEYQNNEVNDDDDENDTSEYDSTIVELLKSNGFKDPNKITIINDNGEEEVVKFSDMSDEDKLGILSYKEEAPKLHDNEVEAINFMRKNKMTLNEIAEYYKEIGRKEAEESKTEPKYDIDQYTDDEIFVADIKNRFDDMTDEEVMEYLEASKANESLYKRQCDKLRSEYKAYEDAQAKEADKAAEERAAIEYQQIIDDITDSSNKIDIINGMKLEDIDKQELLEFITVKDVNGVAPIIKSLENPDILYKVAWFILKGEEAHNSMVKYFTGEINKTKPETKPMKKIENEPIKKKQKGPRSIYDLYN